MVGIHLRLVCLLTLVVSLLSAGTAWATTFNYSVAAGGLDDGHACLSSSGPGTCASSALFTVDTLSAISGGFTYDDVAGTVDLNITLPSGTMVGGYDGVSEIEFISTDYSAAAWTVMAVGSQLLGVGAASGSVDGDYAQFDSVPSLVVGPDPLSASPDFTAFSCLFSGSGGQCGFTVGGSRDFAANVGTTGSGDSFDFVHTFNFSVVVPEPSTASLLAAGLLAAFVSRRRRS